MMNLKMLWYFLSAFSGAGINTGAKRLAISQATLSAAITGLEKTLGAPLFERTAIGLRPTAMAHRLRAFASAVTTDIEMAFLDVSSNFGGATELVPVVCHELPPCSVADWALLRGIFASVPHGVRGLRIAADQGDRGVAKSGSLSFAYGLAQPTPPKPETDEITIADRWCLVTAGPRFPEERPIDWEELHSAPLSMANIPGYPEKLLFGRNGRVEIIRLSRLGEYLEAVSSGSSPSLLLPRSCLPDGFSSNRLRIAEVRSPPQEPAIKLLCHSVSAPPVKRLATEIARELSLTSRLPTYRPTRLQTLEQGLEIQAFRSFTETIRAGSTIRAANRLRIVQPALSRQIRKLETASGQQLFIRSQHGMAPTVIGNRLHMLTKTALADYATGLEQMRSSKRGGDSAHAKVRFGIIPPADSGSLIAQAVANGIAQWKTAFPEAEVMMAEGYSNELLRWLRTDLVDFVIIDTHEKEPGLIVNPIFIEQLSLVFAKGSAWDTGETVISMPQIDARRLCLPSKEFGLRPHFDLAMAGIDAGIAPGLQIDSLAVSLSLLSTGNWATLLPLSAVRHLVASRHLEHRILVHPQIDRRICSVRSLRTPQTPASIALMHTLETTLKQLDDAHTQAQMRP